MYCPNCASKNSVDQKFCRSCGLNLEQTALSLVEQATGEMAGKIELSQRKLDRFGKIAFGGFGVIVLAGIVGLIYTIIMKMVLSGTQPVVGVMLALFVIFAGLALTYVAFNENLKEKREAIKKGRAPAEIDQPSAATLLSEGYPRPVPSVTENTTDLLPVKNKTRTL